MKNLLMAALALFLASGDALADKTHYLHGLFCLTESEARRVLAYMGGGLSLPASVAIVNLDSNSCVIASRLQFLTSGPVIIETVRHGALSLTLYEGTVVAVLVGENPRMLEPPLHMFFVLNYLIKGSASRSST
jgi:hypothetical protein